MQTAPSEAPRQQSSLLPSALPKDPPPNPPSSPQTTQPHAPSPAPHFTPLFTLIATPQGEIHHPHIHYIFSSDSPDDSPITAAALEVLSNAASETPDASRARERYLLLDLSHTGTSVTAARSMSPEFQILGASVGVAPTWETGDEGSGGGAGAGGTAAGLMLKICGTEAGVVAGERGGGVREGVMQGLVEEWEARMGELRRVVEGVPGGLVGSGGRGE